jgi:hypothetical protein
MFGESRNFQINSIDIRSENYLHRDELVDSLMNKVRYHLFTVLSSPPATGKTSLLKLFVHKHHINAKVIRCNQLMAPYDELLLKCGIDLKNETINLPQNESTLIIIDDAQFIYNNEEFWIDLLKLYPDWANGYNIKFIISATHTITYRSESPVGLKDCPRLELKDFLISSKEGVELIGKTFYLQLFSLDQEIIDSIINQCGGVVGAVRLSVIKICETFQKCCPKEGEVLQYYFSQDFMKDWDRLFATERRPVLPEFQEFLTRRLILPSGHQNDLHDDESISTLNALIKGGILTDDGTHVGFSSILAERFYLQHFFPTRGRTIPVSIEELVKSAIGHMSEAGLLMSTVGPNDFPKEAVFQQQFMSGLAKSLPPSCHICPESSKSFLTDRKIPGEIDFYINGNLGWGIELLVKGRGVGEHIARFASPNGKYYGLVLKDYIVIDFRSSSDGSPTEVSPIEKRLSVFFQQGNYSICNCLFGQNTDIVCIKLSC